MKKLKFEEFIISEINSICKKEKINLFLKEEYEKNNEVKKTENSEEISSEKFAKEAKEIKTLAEEVSRMKELLNFKSPLLEK